MPLHLAAKGGHLAVAGLILSRITDKFHSGDRKGRTPLHMAAANGHEDIVRLLLGQGADINAADNVITILALFFFQIKFYKHVHCYNILLTLLFLQNGWTALHYAAKQGYLDMIQLLIDSGASSEAAATVSMTYISVAKYRK